MHKKTCRNLAGHKILQKHKTKRTDKIRPFILIYGLYAFGDSDDFFGRGGATDF